ncbi:MAG TPA: hypothetical protein VL354_19195 [Spirochaetia bacterium]|nr:hypothetical protein [Spirochaetia bacterium]
MKGISIGIVCIALIFALGGQVSAQGQITTTGTNYGASTMTFSPMDQDHWVAEVEQLGVRVDDTGKGPFHLLSTDIKMIMYGEKAGVQYYGYETHVDKDGDKIIWEIWGLPNSNKGKGKIIASTGKFAGAEGTVDFELLNPPKGFPEGTTRTVCREYMKIVLKAPL